MADVIPAVVIGSTSRKWAWFAALPRVGDGIRGVGKVKAVFWKLNLEGGRGRDDEENAPDDRDEVFYPFIQCDDSDP